VKIDIAGEMFQCLAFLCVHGCPQGGQYGNLQPHGNWDKESKIYRKLAVSSLIDLILAMTVLFSDMTLTLRIRRFHCCYVMQF